MERSNDILVSVCCITYNQVFYIRQCLDGFLMQKTNFKFEVIIHDDCSTDGTTDVIREYVEKYPDLIKPIFQERNQYQNGCKRILATFVYPKAQGKYIALCEGDDYWIDPLKLQKQVDFMENNQNCSLVYNRTKRYSERKKIFLSDNDNYEQSQYVRAKDIIEEGGLFVSTCSMLYLKSVIENYPQFCIKCHVGDYPLAIMCAMKGDVYYLNEAMSVYRVDNSNSWVGKQQSEKKMSLSRLNGIVSEVRMLQGFKTLYPQYSDSFNNRIYSFLLGNVPYRYLDARGNKMFIETFSDELAILNKKRRAFFYLKASHLGILFHLFSFLKHKIKHLIK